MQIDNELYFAPEIRHLDWTDVYNLIDAFYRRVMGYYLSPARILTDMNEAFGAGVLCVTTIDFLASIEENTTSKVGDRFERWLINRIPKFDIPDPLIPQQTLACRFYKDFRNGLVHEGRIKNAGQFTLSNDSLIAFERYAMIINPIYLVDWIEDGLSNYRDELLADGSLAQKFQDTLTDRFSDDMHFLTTP
jgi:hypothetical protein